MIVGETISHYRILKLLGAGGMGEVYQAEDTRLKRLVALKLLPLGLVQDRDAKDRLLHEAQAASALDHPNICTIHEVDETPDGRVFVAMSYYDGETLRDRIARTRFTVAETLDIVVHVARAVAAAHERGIIHRDIKPANVMLTARGEVKLLDFGIAKLPGQTVLTRTGTTVGTVSYMAPEQIAGRGADERSDLWALGVVLYEMLAGRPPFTGANELAVVRAIADSQPVALRTLRPDVPAAIESLVDKALQKEAHARYASVADLLQLIEAQRAPTIGVMDNRTATVQPTRPVSSRRPAIVAAVVLLGVALGGWFAYRQARIRSATKTLQQAAQLVQQERNGDAYVLMRQIEPRLSHDTDFARVRDAFAVPLTVRANVPGADLYVKPYRARDSAWERLGQSPLETWGAFALVQWRVTKPGFTPLEGSRGTFGDIDFTLVPNGMLPEGMVYSPGGPVATANGAVSLQEFFIDRYEVTNRKYKEFVQSGGYRNRDYWTEPFVKDGRVVSFDDALAEFRDATGRPGPATWELGSYPEGQDDLPVHGVSWYEAAAFARFARKMLPTVHHWRQAAGLGIYSDILEQSNFGGKGPARVGEFHGIGPYGTFDMAGNVKEWCSNAVGDRRYVLGGGWNEPSYQFREADARLPFDRSANNGIRTMKLKGPSPLPDEVVRPVERLVRDYGSERPVADQVFQAYTSLYGYDRTDLKSAVESVDDTSPSWRIERLSFAAPYGSERVVAYLFLPKNASPPYQTIVYFPHGTSLLLRSFEKAEMSYLGFFVKAGRALLLPMYKGTYERRLVPAASGPNAVRDTTIQQIKDLRRSIDYLETRVDIDRERLAYFGVSFGARLGAIGLAVENRFKAAVLWSGGLPQSSKLGEIDELNYASRVTLPVLMLNGRDDFTFPLESSQLPMFRLLGTAEKDKRRVLYDGGHIFPFARVEKDTLDWLDKYLGVPH